MRFSSLVAAPLAVAGLVAAGPIAPRAAAAPAITDADIIQYALTLEHLEAAFYAEGLDMYNAGAFKSAAFPEWVRERFTEIASHEQTHVTFLSAALTAAGVKPTAACTYDFGITSPEVFLATAQVLEGVGVAAYLGAAPSIVNKAYLAVAGSILVVEAEHQTWVRSAAGNEDGFPRAFQAPLDFSQVYSLAAPFITACPASNPTLPVKAFPALSISTAGPYKVGEKVTVKAPAGLTGPLYAAFVSAAGTTFAPFSTKTPTVTIPAGITGQSYLILTNSNTSVLDANTVAGPALFEVPVPATNFSY